MLGAVNLTNDGPVCVNKGKNCAYIIILYLYALKTNVLMRQYEAKNI